MRKYKSILIYVISLFVIESILQVIFYSIRIKYFDSYSHYEKIYNIMVDSLYVIGTLKLVFFLPLYLLFYFIYIQRKTSLSPIKQSIFHASLFLLLYILLSIVLPGSVASRIVDTSILTIIAFITSFSLFSIKSISIINTNY